MMSVSYLQIFMLIRIFIYFTYMAIMNVSREYMCEHRKMFKFGNFRLKVFYVHFTIFLTKYKFEVFQNKMLGKYMRYMF